MRHVLVIDREFYTRVQLDDQLGLKGYQCTTVKKVKDALTKMRTQIFHLLILSFGDDYESALRFLATVRQTNTVVPVILIAKKLTDDQLLQLMYYRPIEVLVKPYSFLDLFGRMEQLCRPS